MSKELVPLSASRIQTLQKCSWIYYMVYEKKLRDSGNLGTRYGTLVHLIFECLGPKRRVHYIEKIAKSRNIYEFESFRRLIDKTAKKIGLDLEEMAKPASGSSEKIRVKDLINEMVLVGIEVDFQDAAKELIKAEFDFDITEEEKKYRYIGFIDRIFKKDGAIYLSDFKGSRQKYHGEELHSNVQAMLYLLVAKKLYSEYTNRHVRFIFLRFPDDPIAEPRGISDEVLSGFEHYLIFLNEYLQNFSYKKAINGMAADKGYPKDGTFSGLMCCGYAKSPGHVSPKTGELYFCCPYKFPFDYYEYYDNKGELVTSSQEKKKIEGLYSIKKKYLGCPKFNPQNYQKSFDI